MHSFNNLGLIDSDSAAVITFLSVLSLLFYIHRAITVRFTIHRSHTIHTPTTLDLSKQPHQFGEAFCVDPQWTPGKESSKLFTRQTHQSWTSLLRCVFPVLIQRNRDALNTPKDALPTKRSERVTGQRPTKQTALDVISTTARQQQRRRISMNERRTNQPTNDRGGLRFPLGSVLSGATTFHGVAGWLAERQAVYRSLERVPREKVSREMGAFQDQRKDSWRVPVHVGGSCYRRSGEMLGKFR